LKRSISNDVLSNNDKTYFQVPQQIQLESECGSRDVDSIVRRDTLSFRESSLASNAHRRLRRPPKGSAPPHHHRTSVIQSDFEALSLDQRLFSQQPSHATLSNFTHTPSRFRLCSRIHLESFKHRKSGIRQSIWHLKARTNPRRSSPPWTRWVAKENHRGGYANLSADLWYEKCTSSITSPRLLPHDPNVEFLRPTAHTSRN
jgi:hypothetical protein